MLPDTEADGVLAMCTSLYDLSAQCNKKMNDYELVAREMTWEELAEEERACTFIDNIMEGSFDEGGEIRLQWGTFDLADWKNPHQYRRLRMPTDQALLLTFSIILCITLAAAASVLQRAFKRKSNASPWSDERLFRHNHCAQRVTRRRPSLGDEQPFRKVAHDVSIKSTISGVMLRRSSTPLDPDGTYSPPDCGVIV